MKWNETDIKLRRNVRNVKHRQQMLLIVKGDRQYKKFSEKEVAMQRYEIEQIQLRWKYMRNIILRK